eukprot:m.1117940 g.1117940  ORF g.1117940 m.1117940 type:complete len:65 (+) comp24381_c1_seq14:346-540(+)
MTGRVHACVEVLAGKSVPSPDRATRPPGSTWEITAKVPRTSSPTRFSRTNSEMPSGANSCDSRG